MQGGAQESQQPRLSVTTPASFETALPPENTVVGFYMYATNIELETKSQPPNVKTIIRKQE
jgi:hypothetical protein